MATYMDNYYSVIIDESGNIFQINGYQKGQRIGVDIRKEDELLAQITERQEVLDSWRPKMIEAGYIVEPKTPEQIAQEAADEQIRLAKEQSEQQMHINQALMESIQNQNQVILALQNQVGELIANGSSRNCDESSDKQVGRDSKSTGKVSSGSKKCDKSGDENAAGDNE